MAKYKVTFYDWTIDDIWDYICYADCPSEAEQKTIEAFPGVEVEIECVTEVTGIDHSKGSRRNNEVPWETVKYEKLS